ncbi:MAG: RnfABCDGE type electron transport complex subunit C [Bacilli bacterium]
MGFISSRGKIHVEGHKDLTLHSEIHEIQDEKVVGKIYISKLAANGKEIKFDVEVGDEVKMGQRIGERQGFYVPIFAPVSGKIIDIENRYSCSIGRPVSHLIIENDFKYTPAEKLPILDYDKATKEEIISHIKEAGIVGLGGAGFPTYVKYENVTGIKTVIINAIECEPYLTTDYHAIKNYLELFVKGVNLLKRAAGADNAIIAIKKGKAELVAKIRAALESSQNIEVKELDDKYPMGWERVLVYEIMHKDYNMLPSEVGVIVNNASTAIAVADALLNGNPITKRLLTVSGNAIKNQGIALVPVGTPVSGIIEHFGGYTADQVVLLVGGPMVAKGMMNDSFVIEKPAGALTVLIHEEIKASPCLRCGRCTLMCPASLQPVEIKIAVENKNIDRLEALKVNSCIECGTCSLVCPSKIEVTEFMRKAKLQLKIAKAKSMPKKS